MCGAFGGPLVISSAVINHSTQFVSALERCKFSRGFPNNPKGLNEIMHLGPIWVNHIVGFYVGGKSMKGTERRKDTYWLTSALVFSLPGLIGLGPDGHRPAAAIPFNVSD